MSSTARVTGARETAHAFARYQHGIDPAVRAATDRALVALAAAVASAARADADPRSARLASTVSISRGAEPAFGVGGPQRVVSHGSASAVLFGAEFGSRGRWGGFRPYSGTTGHWFFPTVRSQGHRVPDELEDALDQLATEWGRGG